MGFALGTSTLVGQALGRNRPDQALAAAKATMVIVAGYISVLILLFLFVPQPLLELFRPRDVSPQDFAVIKGMGVVVLRFVAAYLLLYHVEHRTAFLFWNGNAAVCRHGGFRPGTSFCLDLYGVIPVPAGLDHLGATPAG